MLSLATLVCATLAGSHLTRAGSSGTLANRQNHCNCVAIIKHILGRHVTSDTVGITLDLSLLGFFGLD